MNKKTLPLLVLLLFLFSPRAWAVTIEKVVAIVNNEAITLTELQERAILMRHATGKNIPLREVLKQIVIETIQAQRAKKLGLEAPDEVVEGYIQNFKRTNGLDDEAFKRLLSEWGVSLEVYKEEVRKRILISKLVNLEVKSRIAIPEEELKEYYEMHKDELYRSPAKARIADIFLPWSGERGATSKLAQEIFQKIKMGESFKQLAALYSKGPNAEEGGDMGYVKEGELIEPLDKFIFSPESKAGDAGLIETEEGIHILKILEKHENVYVPFGKVKDEIEKKLYSQRAKGSYERWLDDLIKKAYVKMKL